MSESFPVRTLSKAVLGGVLLAGCGLGPTQSGPTSEIRTSIAPGQERVTEYRYPNDSSRWITTHTEDHSGALGGRSYDSSFYQYCAPPEGSPAGTAASVLVSEYMKSQLAKDGGNRVMRLIALDTAECSDRMLNSADQGIPNAAPIPPAGEPKDVGSVNQWNPPN